MGFFDSLAKSVGNAVSSAAVQGISTNWEKIRKLPSDRLESLYKDRQNQNKYDMVGMLAILALCKMNSYHPDSMEENQNESWKKRIQNIKKMIELESGREFVEIRDAIEIFERI